MPLHCLKKLCIVALLWTGTSSAFYSTTKSGVSFSQSASDTNGEFFLATATAPLGSDAAYAVALAQPIIADVSEAQQVVLKSLIPSTTQINGKMQRLDKDTYVVMREANPLYGKNIYGLSSYAGQPAVVCGTSSSAARTVAIISDSYSGLSIRANVDGSGNTKTVYDAAEGTATTIRSIVSGSLATPVVSGNRMQYVEQFFVAAAVTPSDSANFAGQDAAGIAVFYSQSSGLDQVDATGEKSNPKAAALKNDTIKIGTTGSISSVSAMHWDATLSRLYIALALQDGGVAVVAGQLGMALVGEEVPDVQGRKREIYRCDAKLALKPVVVGTTNANVAEDWTTSDYIVASKGAGITVQSLDTLHTSTQRSYLVVSRNDTAVYAVPLVRSVSAQADQASVGLLANIADNTAPATAGADAQLYKTTSAAAKVGGGNAPDTIQHMLVKGDSVYVSCAGGTEATNGVFISTALFDKDGVITRWSEWERVFGSSQPVYGFSTDIYARPLCVTGADATHRDTVIFMPWGKGEGNGLWGGSTESPEAGIINILHTAFPRTTGGINTIRAFAGPDAGGGAWYDHSEQLSGATTMIGAGGKNACALVITSDDGAAIDADSFDVDDHYRFFNLDDDAIDVGIVTALGLSRSTNTGLGDADGWFFIGGTNGLAVLCKDDGDGWPSSSVLTNVTRANGYRCLELTKADGSSFSHVRALQADSNALYVVDDNGLYRIAYSANKFKDTPSALGEELIATPATVLGKSGETFLDFIVIANHGILATTSGLWTMTNTSLADVVDLVGAGGWKEIPVTPGGSDSFGVCARLFCIPSAAASSGGELFVLTADVALNISIVQRVVFSNANVTADGVELCAINHRSDGLIRRHTTMLGQLRQFFYTDGAYMIDAGSLHYATTKTPAALVRTLPLSFAAGAVDSWYAKTGLLLEVDETDTLVTGITRDIGTGTVLVSGVWGIRVLQ